MTPEEGARQNIDKQLTQSGWIVKGYKLIKFVNTFYVINYPAKNYLTLFTISSEARNEILKRLLELNHKIHEEEVKAELWKKKTSKKK